MRLHFNETCCSAGGVPEECMGLCREKVEDRSIDLEGTNSREKVEDLRVDLEGRNIHLIMPVDRCVEHQDTIRKCMIQEGKSYIHLPSIIFLEHSASC